MIKRDQSITLASDENPKNSVTLVSITAPEIAGSIRTFLSGKGIVVPDTAAAKLFRVTAVRIIKPNYTESNQKETTKAISECSMREVNSGALAVLSCLLSQAHREKCCPLYLL